MHRQALGQLETFRGALIKIIFTGKCIIIYGNQAFRQKNIDLSKYN